MAENGSALELPKVGDGATIMYHSDRRAATVISVTVSKRGVPTIVVQRDKVTRVDGNGMSECQTYEYAADPNGATDVVKRRKHNGRLVWRTKTGEGIAFGARREYYDFSF